ncbi:MAG TPA: nucleoside transporter C-terminal domain-containing protein, partial [Planctomycetota bacterium]|nr:nucleoside transporter C-terminal domain-containing protein [Planctomycetota bacterium]
GGIFASALPARELLSVKAETMATFALCGFANFASIAIQIGGISPMVPENQQEELRGKLSRLGVRAMFGGAIVSCLTATIAGLLM